MAPDAKTETFIIRLSPSEVQMLAELADETGESRANVVRQLIRKQYAATLGDRPKTAKKKPKR
jgi:predicted DNA-binding protein